jgi:uroporphyrinogen III methyltransferase/synthase
MNEKQGKVWLVGAGPLDAGLMTLKGLDVLKHADVVVYDRLIGDEILGMIPQSARKIYVGKSAGYHTVKQEQINQIILKEALCGNKVVRLKGGDPFLFGRGGEELELLTENNVPFEVVPGVTSAIAVPAYAGIPVTYRDYSSSLHIFTGHFSATGSSELNYKTIAELHGTLVFLMGLSSVRSICECLILAGMSEETPAAIIENGTSVRQRTITATVKTLADEATANIIHSPAIIVIGKAVTLSKRFSWISNRKLNGLRIVVTRPRGLCEDFCEKIRNLGGEAIPFPCIQTTSIFNNETLRHAIDGLHTFSWLAFTSTAGVDSFFESLKASGRDSRALGGLKIAVIGTATASRLDAYGIRPDLIPDHYEGAFLGKALAETVLPNQKVLILRAEESAREWADALISSKISFEEIAVYQTLFTGQDNTVSRELIESGDFEYITFTSASTVRGFVQVFPKLNFKGCVAVCIGSQTAVQAEIFGMRVITAATATVDGMLEALENCYNK